MTSQHVQPPEKGLTMSQPESTETVVHVCPLGDDALTTCCGKSPFELPRSDRITAVPGMGTCRPNVPVVDPARVAVYAEAIFKSQDGWPMAWADLHEDVQAGYVAEAKVAIALADSELAELRAYTARLEAAIDRARMERAQAEDAETAAEAKGGAVLALLPAECWVSRSLEVFCTDFIGGQIGSGTFTEEMCCLPCRVRAALAAASPGAGGLDEREDPRQRADDEAGEVMEWLDREGGE